MKVKNVSLTIGLPKPGSLVETDSMCSSSLRDPQGKWHGDADAEFTMPEWKQDDEFSLSIPSGTFTGKVVYTTTYGAAESAEARSIASVFGGQQPAEEGVRICVLGEWDGKEGGLTGGLCAFGRFQACMNQAVVFESTLLPAGKEISFGAYAWAKDARHWLGTDNGEVAKLIEYMVARHENSPKNTEIWLSQKAPATNQPFSGLDSLVTG